MSLLTLTIPAQRTPSGRLVGGAPASVAVRSGVDAPQVMPAARRSGPGTLVTYVVATPYVRA